MLACRGLASCRVTQGGSVIALLHPGVRGFTTHAASMSVNKKGGTSLYWSTNGGMEKAPGPYHMFIDN